MRICTWGSVWRSYWREKLGFWRTLSKTLQKIPEQAVLRLHSVLIYALHLIEGEQFLAVGWTVDTVLEEEVFEELVVCLEVDQGGCCGFWWISYLRGPDAGKRDPLPMLRKNVSFIIEKNTDVCSGVNFWSFAKLDMWKESLSDVSAAGILIGKNIL